MINIDPIPILRNLSITGGYPVDWKKWIFVLGLSAQAVIVFMMIVLLKELRQEPEEIDLYPEVSVKTEEVVKERASVPFSRYVEGSGKVIPSSEYVKISAPIQGTIEDVFVNVGQKVSAGDLLFKIDDSLLICQLQEKKSEMQTTLAKLEIMQQGANTFDLVLKQKEIEQVKKAHEIHQKEHEILLGLYEKNAISNSELFQKASLVNNTNAHLEKILVEFEKMKSGPSDQEQKLGKALIEERLANCRTIEKQIEDCKIKAPIDGRIFAVNIHPGEFYNSSQTAAIYMGSDDPLHLKVYIDKKDAWMVNPSPKMRAVALHKANPKIQFLLEYVGVNPCFAEGEYLELIFSFDKQKNPVYLDETLDVYIEASEKALLDYQFSHMR